MLLLLLGLEIAQAPETLWITPAHNAPVLDGVASSAEYGAPSLVIAKPEGRVSVWVRRWQDTVYLAAAVEDSTFYWGDDLVIGIDTGGDRATSPQHDDFQFYFRRVLDSSVVFRGRGGRWEPPRDDPDWRLGTNREGGGWLVRSVSDRPGWSLELRLDPDWLVGAGGKSPGLALRTFDDAPQGWYVWPKVERLPAKSLEGRPDRWAVAADRKP